MKIFFFFKWYKDKLTKNSYVSLWRAHSVYTINHPVVLLMLKSTEHCIKVIWIPFKCNFELINIRRTSYFFCFELIIRFIFLLRWAEHFLLAFNNVHSCTEVRCLFFFYRMKTKYWINIVTYWRQNARGYAKMMWPLM